MHFGAKINTEQHGATDQASSTLQALNHINEIDYTGLSSPRVSGTKVSSISEWSFIISIDTSWDWFLRTYVLITAPKNL